MIRTSLLSALALTAAAGAQTPTTTGSTITYSLGFVEIGGNTNGVLEPGESALLRLSVAFTNQNTTTTYSAPGSQYGSGTIRGLGSGYLDLVGSPSAAGAWNVDPANGYGPDPPWDLSGASGRGTPAAGGSRLNNILFGQFPGSPSSIITTNPIAPIWQGLWTPESYVRRTVAFSSKPATLSYSSSVLIKPTPVSYVPVFCRVTFGSVAIPIVPAPATAAIFAGLLLFPRRRPPQR